MATEDRKATWVLDIEGTEKVTSGFNRVADTIDKTDKATTPLKLRFSGVASSISMVASNLSALNPALSGVVSIVGRVTSAASGLMASLGGPVGLGIAGLAGAIALTTRYFDAQREAMKKAEEQMKKAEAAVLSFAQAKAKIAGEEQARVTEQQMAMGVGPAGDYRAKAEQLQSEIELEKQKLAVAQQERGVRQEDYAWTDRIAAKEKDIVDYRRKAREAQEETNAMVLDQLRYEKAIEDLKKQGVIREGKGGGESGAKWYEKETPMSDYLGFAPPPGLTGQWESEGFLTGRKGTEATSDMTKPLEDMMVKRTDLIQQLIDESVDYERKAADEIIKIEEDKAKRLNDLVKGLDDEWYRLHEEAVRRSKENADMMTQHWIDFASVGPKAAANALYDLAKGYKVNAAKMIEGIGDTLWNQGLSDVLRAAAMAWNPLTAGFAGGLAQAGAAEMAAGLAMGAIGARSGEGKGGAEAPARTEYRGSYRSDKGEGGTIVINVQALEPTAETGLRIKSALDNAYQKRGYSAQPEWSR